jgi:hypothetical protein
VRIAILAILIFAPLFGVDIRAKNYSGKVKFIKQINLNAKFTNYPFAEISDLAYNRKKGLLYMVSDKGILYTFKANFTDTNFAIKPLKATYFKRKNGKRLRAWNRDTEGIALDKRGRIFVSREGKPTVTQFSNNGVKIKNIKLPKALSKAKLRSRNKSLESLAYHPKYGLLTALEWPPKGVDAKVQTIYSLKGKQWHFKMQDHKKNAISEIEVANDGNLLVLERAYNGFFGKFVVTLTKVYLNESKAKYCKSEVLLSIDSSKGWYVENFEGLARVGKNRYLMISDDNSNFFQKTLLIYFEIE